MHNLTLRDGMRTLSALKMCGTPPKCGPLASPPLPGPAPAQPTPGPAPSPPLPDPRPALTLVAPASGPPLGAGALLGPPLLLQNLPLAPADGKSLRPHVLDNTPAFPSAALALFHCRRSRTATLLSAWSAACRSIIASPAAASAARRLLLLLLPDSSILPGGGAGMLAGGGVDLAAGIGTILSRDGTG